MRIKEVESYVESIKLEIDDERHLAPYFMERAELVGHILHKLLDKYDDLEAAAVHNRIGDSQDKKETSGLLNRYNSTSFLLGEDDVNKADIEVMEEVLDEMLRLDYVPPLSEGHGLATIKIHLAVLWAFYGFCRPAISLALVLRLDVSAQKLTNTACAVIASVPSVTKKLTHGAKVKHANKKQRDQTTDRILSAYNKLSPEWLETGGRKPIVFEGKSYSVNAFSDIVRDQMKKDFHRDDVKSQKWVATRLKELRKDGSI